MSSQPPIPSDAYSDLVREVVEAITESRAAQQTTRETLDRLGLSLDEMTAVTKASQAVLARLVEGQEIEATRQAELRAGRYALLSRLANSGPIQLLIAGFVVASLQALGVGYLVSELVPTITTAPAELPPNQ